MGGGGNEGRMGTGCWASGWLLGWTQGWSSLSLGYKLRAVSNSLDRGHYDIEKNHNGQTKHACGSHGTQGAKGTHRLVEHQPRDLRHLLLRRVAARGRGRPMGPTTPVQSTVPMLKAGGEMFKKTEGVNLLLYFCNAWYQCVRRIKKPEYTNEEAQLCSTSNE